MLSNAIRPICRNVLARTGCVRTSFARNAHDLTPKDKPLMDLLPIPEGSWEEAYKAKQAKYNIHLAAGVLFFAFTLGVAYKGGYLFLNALLPPLPEKK
ncbi:cytochrome c oxidase subunit 7B [Lycorma delicatula]|uniref:cytochrome c oxidase subunit 7B n=1 Tax=Lycorma delicatula TaxID=130591 RepID=UPI003F514A1B